MKKNETEANRTLKGKHITVDDYGDVPYLQRRLCHVGATAPSSGVDLMLYCTVSGGAPAGRLRSRGSAVVLEGPIRPGSFMLAPVPVVGTAPAACG